MHVRWNTQWGRTVLMHLRHLFKNEGKSEQKDEKAYIFIILPESPLVYLKPRGICFKIKY